MEKDSNAIYQKNLNQRLNYLTFKSMSKSDFDADEGNHSDEQITFVNDGDKISLYKGDTKVSYEGGLEANMYKKSPYGGDFKSSDIYEPAIQDETYGIVQINNFGYDLVIAPFKGRRGLEDADFRCIVGMLNAPLYSVPVGTNEVSRLNRTAVMRFAVSGNRGQTRELLEYTVHMGGFIPQTSAWTSDNSGTQLTPDTDWDSTMRFTYNSFWYILCSRYQIVNDEPVLLQKGYYNINHTVPYTRFRSRLWTMAYPVTLNTVEREYNKDTGGGGIVPIIPVNSISDSSHGFGIGFIYEPSLEKYGGGIGNINGFTYFIPLRESSGEFYRMGISYDLLNGEELEPFVIDIDSKNLIAYNIIKGGFGA
jgi:hypothetical protein